MTTLIAPRGYASLRPLSARCQCLRLENADRLSATQPSFVLRHGFVRYASNRPAPHQYRPPLQPPYSPQTIQRPRRPWRYGLLLLALPLGYYTWGIFTRPSSKGAVLQDHSFTPYKLISKDRVSDDLSIFLLRPAKEGHEPRFSTIWGPSGREEEFEGRLWSVEIKQPDLQISRSYTPLPPVAHDKVTTQGLLYNVDDVRLLVRHYPKGEMSSWLFKRPISSIIELRGPQQNPPIPRTGSEGESQQQQQRIGTSPGDFYLFIAGGTGISPALQVAHHVRDGQILQLFLSVRKAADIFDPAAPPLPPPLSEGPSSDEDYAHEEQPPFRPQSNLGLEISQALGGVWDRGGTANSYCSADDEPGDDGRVTLWQRADRKPDFTWIQDHVLDLIKLNAQSEAAVKAMLEAQVGSEAFDEALVARGGLGRNVIFVSGPDGFVEHWVGKKKIGVPEGDDQGGPVGGWLGKMGVDKSGWEVVRLW